VLDHVTSAFAHRGPSAWAFRHYLDIAPPEFALPGPGVAADARGASAIAA
jgi:hypothetical protein